MFGHGCVSVSVMEGNRPLVSRFPPYLENRADVVTSFLVVFLQYYQIIGDRGSTVVKVLCYKSEGRWFDPGWCHLNFSLT